MSDATYSRAGFSPWLVLSGKAPTNMPMGTVCFNPLPSASQEQSSGQPLWFRMKNWKGTRKERLDKQRVYGDEGAKETNWLATERRPLHPTTWRSEAEPQGRKPDWSGLRNE